MATTQNDSTKPASNVATVFPPKTISPPEGLPKNAPVMPEIKHPCRCAILGTTHSIDQLKQILDKREDISDEIKAVIKAEISNKTSNAAQVDMHVVDHANGDSSIVIHVKQVTLG